MMIEVPLGREHIARNEIDGFPMIVVPDYRSHRIDVSAIGAGEGRWRAAVSIRRTLSEENPYRQTVTCFKLTAELAERTGALWAKRWVDLKTGKLDRGAIG